MDQQTLDTTGTDRPASGSGGGNGLSYKFQRLRERLRASVAAGELSGKLPGERTLAKRFQVNAKTLSKALTDLAAEGLLDRSIGRGTYVKPCNADVAAPTEAEAGAPAARGERWLVLADEGPAESAALRAFLSAQPGAVVIRDLSPVRPSFLRQFGAVVDFAAATPDRFLRDLVVRNLAVVTVDREPGLYALHHVGIDRVAAGFELTRDLILSGHKTIGVVAKDGGGASHGARLATARYGGDVQPLAADRAVEVVRTGGATAIVCDGESAAARLRDALAAAGPRAPRDVSIAAIGYREDGREPAISGQYVSAADLARAVCEAAQAAVAAHRPASAWLAGKWVDAGTTGGR